MDIGAIETSISPLALPETERDGAAPTGAPGPGLVLIGALYLTQGIPIGFLFEALPVLLRQQGVPLEAIAVLPLAALPWIFKFLWAPLVDNRFSRRLGRRRSWIVPMQTVLVISLAVCAFLPPTAQNVGLLLAAFLIGSVAAATQDTATDGLAAESLAGPRLATANGLQAGGMMAGFMLGGAGALILTDHLGYSIAVLVLAGVAALCLVPVLAWREQDMPLAAPRPPARVSHTLRRKGVGLLLLLGLLYGTEQSSGTSLSRLMLADAGWSLSHLGLLAAAGGSAMIVLGAPLGARAVARLGTWRALGIGLGVGISALGLWLVLVVMPQPPLTALAVLAAVAVGTGGGMISVAASTIAMRFAAQGNQAGTDVTVLQSAHVTGDMAAGSLAVGLASAAGYGGAFAGALVVTALTLGLAALMARRPSLQRL